MSPISDVEKRVKEIRRGPFATTDDLVGIISVECFQRVQCPAPGLTAFDNRSQSIAPDGIDLLANDR